jgi:hypothetical protein
MKKALGFSGIFLLLGFLTAVSAPISKWQKFDFDEARFSVSVPQMKEVRAPNGQKWDLWVKNDSGLNEYYFGVSYQDVTGTPAPVQIFKEEKASIEQNDHPEKIDQKVFKYKGYAACQYSFIAYPTPSFAQWTIRRIIVVNRRVYSAEFIKNLTEYDPKGHGMSVEVRTNAAATAKMFFESLVFVHPELNMGLM